MTKDKLKQIERYRYLGNVYPQCNAEWYGIVLSALKEIDKRIYPWYMPRFMKLFFYWLHFYSPWCIKKRVQGKFYYYEISQIKEKFGALRIYDCDEDIYEKAHEESWNTCEMCGSKENLGSTMGWIKRLCEKCAKNQNNKWNIDKLNKKA